MGVARGEFSKARPGTKFATELSQYNELMYQLAAVNTNIELETGDWRVESGYHQGKHSYPLSLWLLLYFCILYTLYYYCGVSADPGLYLT